MINTPPVKMSMRPAITICNNKKYAVGGEWVEIPMYVDYSNLHEYAVYEPPATKKQLARYSVKSTNGKTKYNVDVWEDKITCDCSGYRWRNKCKHASAVQKANNRLKGKG